MSAIRSRRIRVAAARLALPSYSEWIRARLCGRGTRTLMRTLAAVSAVGLALSAGGCSYRLGSLTEKYFDKSHTTGSIGKAHAAAQVSADVFPPADLASAKGAVVELMARGASDASQPWENPRTGARGAITPIATAYARDGVSCRDFLASYLLGPTESWYQGGACRKGSKWEVQDIRPLQRS